MKIPSRSLRRHTSAAVAVIFATSLVPICMLVGLVFDFGFVMQVKSKLDLAADAAALAALRVAAVDFAANDSQAQINSDANNTAQQWWTAQVGTIPNVESTTLNLPVLGGSGPTFTANVSYSAKVFEFMPLIFKWRNPQTGQGDAIVANTSSATITTNSYGTIDFLLDNTSSMLLPATPADLQLLQNAELRALKNLALQYSAIAGANLLVGWNGDTNNPLPVQDTNPVQGFTLPQGGSAPQANLYCAFACHWSTTGQDYYALARAAGEKLRFDVVQSATITAIQQMEAKEAVLGQLAVGVFDFGGLAMNTPAYLQTIYAETPLDTVVNGLLTQNAGANAAIQSLASISPPITGDTPNTNIGQAMGYMQAITGPGGNGATTKTPLKSLILVTDGVEDDTLSQNIGVTEGPINPAVCDSLKTAGYTIYVLYTPYASAAEYLPANIPLQPYITGTVTPNILSALQSCSSGPGDLITAISPTEIQAGMNTLVARAVGNTTLVTN